MPNNKMEELLRQVQASRNQPPKVLFEGGLQGNTDQYLNKTNLFSQDVVPAPPRALFCENGASVELDERMFMVPVPQVPANPELEALNSYFNQKRITDFATGQRRGLISEEIQKQAEMTASTIIKDEVDRRAGIRRSVLDATGLTPAQIEVQLAQEALGGINGRTLDIRDRQVQDIVDRFYRINNIPKPVTTAENNPVPATIPSGTGQPPAEEEEGEMPQPEAEPDMSKYPEFTTSSEMAQYIERNPKPTLAEYIVARQIKTPRTTKRSGAMKSVKTIGTYSIQELRNIISTWYFDKAGSGAADDGMGGAGGEKPKME
jgi:hypothetical protein